MTLLFSKSKMLYKLGVKNSNEIEQKATSILAGVRDNLLKPMAGEIITQQAEQIKSLQENLASQQQENLKNIAWIKIFLILIVVLQISMAMLFFWVNK